MFALRSDRCTGGPGLDTARMHFAQFSPNVSTPPERKSFFRQCLYGRARVTERAFGALPPRLGTLERYLLDPSYSRFASRPPNDIFRKSGALIYLSETKSGL